MSTKSCEKVAENFCCLICDYNTCRKSSYDKHLLTSKHKNQQKSTESCEKVANNSNIFQCYCGKQYKDRSGLWRHKSKCEIKETISENNLNTNITTNSNDLIIMLIKQNSELIKDNSEFKNIVIEQQNKIFEQQSMVMKVLENGTNNTTITTNSHNKAFNLNFFLNETCKDAMNIMDFVESIKLQLSDLERVGEKGYIEGISNIIIKNLKDLDVTQRPVHCTDKKRETIYVKDEDKWEKDDENKKMHKLVRKIQDKNFRMIQKFKEKYPNYYKASSKESDVYNNIIIESMGGKGDNDFEKEEKIIKRVSKEIGVEK
jgi:hypothetical protein